ncbi:MAG TPA: sugar phosphate isomerase/epimerase family protein [Vicinamibacterales bacterium]|nr:sugar phosphate isomerase/epimerase family protein [Vicinamibacterales bacterium]
MRFALSTHLFHDERLSRAHLAAIAAAGFTDVEVFATRSHVDYHDRGRVHEVRGWLAGLGLSAVSVHGPICESYADGRWGRAYSIASTDRARRDEGVAEVRAAIEAARVLGAVSIVVHLGLPHGQPIPPGDNDAGAARRSLDTLVAIAHDAGVRVAVELVPNALSTADELAALFEGDLDLGETGTCVDLGHAHLAGAIDEAIDRLGGTILTTHVHDNHGREDTHLVPYQGTIDWPSSLASLWKVGYRGPLVFEVADRGDAMAVLGRVVDARARLQVILDDLDGFDFGDQGG